MRLKELTEAEFYDLFDPEVHEQLKAIQASGEATAFVVFENHQFDSSAFGERSALPVGPGYSTKTIEECDGKHLNDLPSQRQYAVSYFRF